MIDEITEHLFIGKARLAYQPDILIEHEISTVVKLFESPPEWPTGFEVIDRPFADGEAIASEKLGEFDRLISEAIGSEKRVLVVCGAGISRSATVLLSYLVSTGMPLKSAYQLLKTQHPETEPHPELWLSLINHHQLPHSLSEVLGWRTDGNARQTQG